MAETQPSPEAIRLGQRISKAAGGQFAGGDRPTPGGLAALKEKVLPPSREEQERRGRLWRETHEFLAPAPSREALERWANVPPEIRDGVVSAYKDARRFRDAVEKKRAGAERKQEQVAERLQSAHQNLEREQDLPISNAPEHLVSQDPKKLAKLQEAHLRAREKFHQTNRNLENVRARTANYPEGKVEQINKKFEMADNFLRIGERIKALQDIVNGSEGTILNKVELAGLRRFAASFEALPKTNLNELQKLRVVAAVSAVMVTAFAAGVKRVEATEIAMIWSATVSAAEFASLGAELARKKTNRTVGLVEIMVADSLGETGLGNLINQNFARLEKMRRDRKQKEQVVSPANAGTLREPFRPAPPRRVEPRPTQRARPTEQYMPPGPELDEAATDEQARERFQKRLENFDEEIHNARPIN